MSGTRKIIKSTIDKFVASRDATNTFNILTALLVKYPELSVVKIFDKFLRYLNYDVSTIANKQTAILLLEVTYGNDSETSKKYRDYVLRDYLHSPYKINTFLDMVFTSAIRTRGLALVNALPENARHISSTYESEIKKPYDWSMAARTAGSEKAPAKKLPMIPSRTPAHSAQAPEIKEVGAPEIKEVGAPASSALAPQRRR